MTANTMGGSLAFVIPRIVVALGALVAGRTALATAQQQRPDSIYQVITKGLLGGPVYPVQFRTARLRLETRNLIMGTGKAERVPTPARTIMELRGGAVIATVNGKRQEHVPGDFWVVNKGDTLSLENQGDVAVIRAVQILEGGP